MSDTPTPRTDALYYPFGENATAMYSPDLGAAIAFARQLERELAEAVAALLLVSGAIDRLHEIVRGDVHSEGEIIFVVNNAQNAARAILARYKE